MDRALRWCLAFGLLMGCPAASAASVSGDDPAGDLAWRDAPLPPNPIDDRFRTADLIAFEAVLTPSGDVEIVIGSRPRAEGPEAPLAGSTLFRIHFEMRGQAYQVVLERSRPLGALVNDASYVSAQLYREHPTGEATWPGEDLPAWDDIANASVHTIIPAALVTGAMRGFWVDSQTVTGILSYFFLPLFGGGAEYPALVDRLPDTGPLLGSLGKAEPTPAASGDPSVPPESQRPNSQATARPEAEQAAGDQSAQGAQATPAPALGFVCLALAIMAARGRLPGRPGSRQRPR